MPGERQLPVGCEDPQSVVGRGVGGLQEERRLTQVGPCGERRHRLAGEVVGVVDDGDRVALGEPVGEDVDLRKRCSVMAGSPQIVPCGARAT